MSVTEKGDNYLANDRYRVLMPDAWAIVLCDFETILHLKPAAEMAGFEFRRPAIWDKVHHGLGYPFMGQHEFIVPLKKGRPRG